MAAVFPDPVRISAEEIARFRRTRVFWLEDEAGAPALVPDGAQPDRHFEALGDSGSPGDFERLFLAFGFHATLQAGDFPLDPDRLIGRHPALPGGAAPPLRFRVTDDHRTLIRLAWWKQGFVDPKYPYGNYHHTEADVAGRLGHVVPLDDTGTFTLSPQRETHYRRLHHETALALAVVLTEAQLAPGTYRLPIDGWRSVSAVRLSPVDPAALLAYNAAWAAHAVAPSQPTWSLMYRAGEALRV
ncbi:MAG: hypothetical protein JJT81_14645 [Rubellimicrobium sp.]|nr:hypothetical protein [Rubellimicrobium sp.]